MAAFVENVDLGDCASDDETGALTLDSPTIEIPAGAEVPRISIDHWFDIEHDWDGGNLKISVNDGDFTLVPPEAIEYGSYNATLEPAMEDGEVHNTNPLAGQLAYSGPETDEPAATWGDSHINLLGIAQAGDTVRLRFDFGIDGCDGNVGWYVDDVEFYYCEAELPPSDCGNAVIDSGEQCDDGNDFIEDGCSNTCQIEDGWECTQPIPPGPIQDPSFEDGTPNGFWIEVSDNSFGTPICDNATCGPAGGSGPSDGTFWAWFGGVVSGTQGSLTQSLTIPTENPRLAFDFEARFCDSAVDFVEVLIDGNQEWVFNGGDPLCGSAGYLRQSVDISNYADGAVHELKFYSETFGAQGTVSNFFVDNTELPGEPSYCSPVGTSLILVKDVINDHGGSAEADEWTLSASGPTPFSGSGPKVASPAGFSAGTYVLAESGPAGYSASTWDCVGGSQLDGDTISVGVDEDAICTITNDDILPTLTVSKTIINDSGGTVTNPDAFGLMVDGEPVQHGVAEQYPIGAHTVSETGHPDYQAGPWGGDCAPDGSITLTSGQNATCTITNDDDAVSLTLVKEVVNDNGGSAAPSEWTLTATGPTSFSGTGPSVSSGSGFNAGTYDLSESGPAGYQAGPWVCVGGAQDDGDTITLALGESATCTITNDDISPTITVVKSIVNDNGGTETDPDAFGLMVDGNPVLHNATSPFDAGPHTVSEAGLSGYVPSPWGGDCNTDGTITLALAQNAICTITNDDSDETSLTLVKEVVNDNGGTAEPTWILAASGPTGFAGEGPIVSSGPDFSAGTYNLAESGGSPGYAASAWVCVGATQDDADTVTLALGEMATCTITNDDIPPTLTVQKSIINDNGGTETDPDAFGLMVDGNTVMHNVATLVDAGMHTVSEAGLAGYIPGPWGGDCNADGTIRLALDQAATCTITNDDTDATSLTLNKQVINDDGGPAAPSEWTLTATGPTGFSGLGPSVSSGDGFSAGTYDLSESGPAGYGASAWVCTGGTQNDGDTITLELGESASCTITNDDISPTITVVKSIVNDNGGTETDPDAFGLMVDGNPVLHNVTNPFDTGPHTVSETGLAGYEASAWGGDCNADGTITLALAQDATCTITNDDTVASLTLVKDVVNDNGGSAAASEWTLTATGPVSFSGTGPSVSSGSGFQTGTYDLSESGPVGYEASAWVCVGGTQDDGDTITLQLGESATCTITNDDISPTITVVKTIVNDNGGTETDPDAFGLMVDGNSVMHNVTNEFDAGPHTVSETGLPDYEPGPWGGDCNADGTISLALDQDAVCSITNDDVNPSEIFFIHGFESN